MLLQKHRCSTPLLRGGTSSLIFYKKAAPAAMVAIIQLYYIAAGYQPTDVYILTAAGHSSRCYLAANYIGYLVAGSLFCACAIDNSEQAAGGVWKYFPFQRLRILHSRGWLHMTECQ